MTHAMMRNVIPTVLCLFAAHPLLLGQAARNDRAVVRDLLARFRE